MKTIQKNTEIEIYIDDLTSEGIGVGHYIDKDSASRPLAIFIPGALPTETVLTKIVKVEKKFAWGRLQEVVKPSSSRINPTCKHYRLCGGCNMAHMAYSAELEFKRKKVVDALQRIGGIKGAENLVSPVVASPSIEHYRNKSAYPVGANGIGMYRTRSHDIVPIEHCCIQSTEAKNAVAAVQTWMQKYDVPAYDERAGTGVVRYVYVRTNYKGEFLLCLIVKCNSEKDVPNSEELITLLRKQLPLCVGVILNFNTRNTNVILGRNYKCIWGEDSLVDEVCGLKFQLSVPSFFQVNRAQAAALYKRAIELTDLQTNDIVADLYCGVGTITLLMAAHCEIAYGVEIVPEAINNAWHNACENNIKNVEFSCMDAGKFASGLTRRGLKPDVVCVDPPRSGLNAECVSALMALLPNKIIYISCKPSTLARDLALFEKNYDVATVEPFDMFPRTHHVETLVLLERN